MVITRRLRFRHILFTMCLIIVLIAGTGIASAAVSLREPGIMGDLRGVHQKCLMFGRGS